MYNMYFLVANDVATWFHYMFPPVQRNFPQNVEISPLSRHPRRPSPGRIDNRVTASRSRRLRVLLTGRHGNLATSLQWPKVDGLRAGAPEQTEQKSVHARTRSRTCYARRSLSLLPPSLSAVLPTLFFFLSSRRVAFRIASRINPARGTCWWCLCLVPGPSRLPVGTHSRGRSDSRWQWHYGVIRSTSQQVRLL